MPDEAKKAGMLCPVCKVDLVMSERQNIEIDYCPQCRGVWLDRGELDKIVERSISIQDASPQTTLRDEGSHGYGSSPWSGHDEHRRSSHRGDDRHGGQGRRGFLGGLFDH